MYIILGAHVGEVGGPWPAFLFQAYTRYKPPDRKRRVGSVYFYNRLLNNLSGMIMVFHWSCNTWLDVWVNALKHVWLGSSCINVWCTLHWVIRPYGFAVNTFRACEEFKAKLLKHHCFKSKLHYIHHKYYLNVWVIKYLIELCSIPKAEAEQWLRTS